MKFFYTGASVQDLTKVLSGVFANVSTDNMRVVSLTGKTSATPDEAQRFTHNVGRKPVLIVVNEGDVYVPKKSDGTSMVDLNGLPVASRLASQPFTLALIF